MTGVTTEHEEYREYAAVWEEMRDHLKGSRAIKHEGTKYLPMLGDERDQEDRKLYVGYLERALYFEATKRTREAMVGAMFMKPPSFTNLDDKYRADFKQVTMDGYSMDTFMRNVVHELVSVSRTGVLVERAREENGGHLYFVQYKAEDIINWRFERLEDDIVLTLVVLEEKYFKQDGRFETDDKIRFRVLELIDGIYVQSVFESAIGDRDEVYYAETDEIIPVNVGEPLDYIPFVFFTPLGNVPDVCEPVLGSISAINLSHYRTSADLEHGRHYTGLPTAWVAGFDTDQHLQLGSQVAWVSEQANARAGFLEFTGQGLGTLQIALAEKQEQMATMGARMLRPPRSGVEAAETARIYQSAESGTLGNLSLAASESFSTLIHYWLTWQGVVEHDVTIEMNTDFIDSRIDPSSITAMLQLWMAGGISYDTLFYNLQNGEIVPDGVTSEEEQDKIAMEAPAPEPEPEPMEPEPMEPDADEPE